MLQLISVAYIASRFFKVGAKFSRHSCQDWYKGQKECRAPKIGGSLAELRGTSLNIVCA